MPNLPFTFPLKFPLNVKDPLSVSDAKHDELVVNLKFVMARDPSPFTFIDVPNANTGCAPPLIRLAFHVPFTLDAFELLFEPHPIKVNPSITSTVTKHCFIRETPGLDIRRAPMVDAKTKRCGGFGRYVAANEVPEPSRLDSICCNRLVLLHNRNPYDGWHTISVAQVPTLDRRGRGRPRHTVMRHVCSSAR